MDKSNIDELYQELGRRIREQRCRHDSPFLTQEELAQRVGLSRTSIVNIESGRQRPPLHLLYSISETLGIELASLLPPSPHQRADGSDAWEALHQTLEPQFQHDRFLLDIVEDLAGLISKKGPHDE